MTSGLPNKEKVRIRQLYKEQVDRNAFIRSKPLTIVWELVLFIVQQTQIKW